LKCKENEYNEKAKKIYAKKERLFEERNKKQWELTQNQLKKISIDDVVNNKELAMKLILPKETRIVEDAYSHYGYYVNSIIKTFQRFTLDQYKRIRKNTLQATSRNMKMSEDLIENWRLLDSHLKEKISKKTTEEKSALLQKMASELMKTPSGNIISFNIEINL